MGNGPIATMKGIPFHWIAIMVSILIPIFGGGYAIAQNIEADKSQDRRISNLEEEIKDLDDVKYQQGRIIEKLNAQTNAYERQTTVLDETNKLLHKMIRER